MKFSSQALQVAALTAAVASAQNTVVNNPSDTSVTTVFYSTCPSAVSTTITLPGTITYCPGPNCNGGGAQITPAPGAGRPGEEIFSFTTTGADGKVYEIHETVYDQPCPSSNGMCHASYTITEACPCQATHNSNAIPSGFTTTVMACSACGANDEATTVTITTPCSTGAYASVTPVIGPGPAAGASSGSGAGSGSGSVSGAGAGAGAGSASGAASAAGPASTASSGNGAGAGAGAGGSAAAAGYPSANSVTGSNSTVSPPITPASPAGSTYTGSADRTAFALSALLAGVVGCLAWML